MTAALQPVPPGVLRWAHHHLQETVIAAAALVLLVPPQFLAQLLVVLLHLAVPMRAAPPATGPSACGATASWPCAA